MRIVFVTPEFVTEEYFSGGLANYLHRLSTALTELGHEVDVILPARGDAATERSGKVRIHYATPASLPGWGRALLRAVPGLSRHWLGFGAAAWQMLEELSQARPVDLVQVTNLQACGLFIVTCSAVPHLTRLSSLPEWEREWVRPSGGPTDRLADWLERLQVRWSRHVCAPSRALAAAAATHRRDPVEVLRSPAFIETEQVDVGWADRVLGNRRYLLFVGRLERRKGAHILAQALPPVFRALPDCEAVFAGQDRRDHTGSSMEAQIRAWCQDFGPRVHFLGALSHPRLYAVMQRARLVVLPSLADNLPNTMLEAMCLGRPVVGTMGASFDEIIEDGHSGFLVPRANPEALAVRIQAAWLHPALTQIGENGRAAVRPFAPETTVQSHLSLYARIAGGVRAPGGA